MTRVRGKWVTVVSLVVLAFGGYVKGSRYLAWIPVDLTLLAAVVVVLRVGQAMTHRPPAIRHRPWLVALFTACLIGLGHPGVEANQYAASKPLAVFVMATLCILGGAHLLRSPAGRQVWVVCVAALGLVVLILARLDPSVIAAGRLAIEGGNTIGAGRGAGAALVVFALAAVLVRRHRMVLLLLTGVAAWGVVATGSRGPLIAAAVAVVAAAVMAASRGRVLRLAVVLLAGGAVAQSVLQLGAYDPRLATLTDASSQMRRYLWDQSWAIIPREPFGIGWGRLYEETGVAVLDSGYVQYPHNLILEVTSEAGWAAGALLVAVLVLALRRQVRLATNPVETIMLGLLIFALINAMVSGDVNANRGLWVAIGAAFVPLLQREPNRLEVGHSVRSGGRARQDDALARVHAGK